MNYDIDYKIFNMTFKCMLIHTLFFFFFAFIYFEKLNGCLFHWERVCRGLFFSFSGVGLGVRMAPGTPFMKT